MEEEIKPNMKVFRAAGYNSQCLQLTQSPEENVASLLLKIDKGNL